MKPAEPLRCDLSFRLTDAAKPEAGSAGLTLLLRALTAGPSCLTLRSFDSHLDRVSTHDDCQVHLIVVL